jgi:hypothetical protein
MEIIKDQYIHETIGQSITIAVKEMEKRMLDMVVIIPILNQLPLPSKQRIDQSRRDIKHSIRNIIDQRIILNFTI